MADIPLSHREGMAFELWLIFQREFTMLSKQLNQQLCEWLQKSLSMFIVSFLLASYLILYHRYDEFWKGHPGTIWDVQQKELLKISSIFLHPPAKTCIFCWWDAVIVSVGNVSITKVIRDIQITDLRKKVAHKKRCVFRGYNKKKIKQSNFWSRYKLNLMHYYINKFCLYFFLYQNSLVCY